MTTDTKHPTGTLPDDGLRNSVLNALLANGIARSLVSALLCTVALALSFISAVPVAGALGFAGLVVYFIVVQIDIRLLPMLANGQEPPRWMEPSLSVLGWFEAMLPLVAFSALLWGGK